MFTHASLSGYERASIFLTLPGEELTKKLPSSVQNWNNWPMMSVGPLFHEHLEAPRAGGLWELKNVQATLDLNWCSYNHRH